MKTIKKKISRFVSGLSGRKKTGYQDRRYPEDQYDLISVYLKPYNIRNILEIGCNQGKLISRFADNGVFCVGVDIARHWESQKHDSTAFAIFPIDSSSHQKLPSFQCAFLLSVHHQWVNKHGEEYAKTLVRNLYDKTEEFFFIEFSACAFRYGYEPGARFEDNDEESVKAFAMKWLSETGLNSVEYLGKTRENPPKEPYRYVFVVKKSSVDNLARA